MSEILDNAIAKLNWSADRTDGMSADLSPAESNALLDYIDGFACQADGCDNDVELPTYFCASCNAAPLAVSVKPDPDDPAAMLVKRVDLVSASNDENEGAL